MFCVYTKGDKGMGIRHTDNDMNIAIACEQAVSMFVHVCVTGCTVCVQGHDPLTFSFLSFLFFGWVGVLWSQLSKVLKLVCWASSVPFPPVSLQRQIVCLLSQPVFISGEIL